MEIRTDKRTIEAEKIFPVQKAQLLLRAEGPVSGVGRENVQVLMSDAYPVIRVGEAVSERLMVEGEVRCQAAYIAGDETAARAIHAKAPISHVFDMRGAGSGVIANARAEVDEVKCRYENGHMVFDVAVTVQAIVTSLAPVTVIAEVVDAPFIETEYTEIVSEKLAAENTVTEMMSKSIPLPAALDARYALMEWATVTDLNYAKDPGGLRLTGNVLVETLISGGANAQPAALIKYRLPIDRFMEMPEWLTDNVALSSRVTSVSTQVDQAETGEDATLLMDAEIEITAAASATDRVMALKDAFSTGDEQIEPTVKSFDVCLKRKRLQLQEPFRASVILKEGAGAVGQVCAVKTRAQVGEVSSDGSKTTVSGLVNAQVMYLTGNGGKLMGESAYLPFEIMIAAPVSEDAVVCVEALNAEGNALMSDRIEIKCMLSVTADDHEACLATVADSIESAGPVDRKKGITIVWPSEEDTAWSVAKRMQIPVKSVEIASNGEVSSQKPIVLRL